EEEARASARPEGGEAAPPPAAPRPAVTLAKAGPGTAAAPSPPESPRAVNLEADYQRRVKGLADDLKKAVASGSEAGKEAKLRFSESQVFARKQDFAQATALLDAVAEQIKKA